MARKPNALKAVQLDRAAGVLVAAAVGDALGAGYEFRSPCPPDEVQMLPGALTGRAAGSWAGT
jgi:ADP-ribosylglycohydrolase